MQILSQYKIVSTSSLMDKVKYWKRQEQSIVFTNGCFDILHAGHVDYLEKARDFGHKLIVGLNTDASIKKNKGNHRPINNEFSRAKVLSALQFVDLIVFFEEATPYNLIKSIIPDILVKGSDYQLDDIVGSELVLEAGGQVKTVALLEGYSTTNIINKIKHL